MKRIVPAIAILVILIRCVYSFCISTANSAYEIMMCEYIKDTWQYFVIGILLIYAKQKQNECYRLILNFGIVFCAMTCILLLYVFLPAEIAKNILYVSTPYFAIWTMIAFGLSIYYYFCLKADLLA